LPVESTEPFPRIGTCKSATHWTVGESLVAAMIARACAPRSKRAFADWAKTTHLPDLMHFTPSELTSQHFWDQMNAVPVEKLALIEQELVREVVRIEQLQLRALAYDTTNFYTHIASANLRPKLPSAEKTSRAGTICARWVWRW